MARDCDGLNRATSTVSRDISGRVLQLFDGFLATVNQSWYTLH